MSYRSNYAPPVDLSGIRFFLFAACVFSAIAAGLAGLHEYRYQKAMQQIEDIQQKFTDAAQKLRLPPTARAKSPRRP